MKISGTPKVTEIPGAGTGSTIGRARNKEQRPHGALAHCVDDRPNIDPIALDGPPIATGCRKTAGLLCRCFGGHAVSRSYTEAFRGVAPPALDGLQEQKDHDSATDCDGHVVKMKRPKMK